MKCNVWRNNVSLWNNIWYTYNSERFWLIELSAKEKIVYKNRSVKFSDILHPLGWFVCDIAQKNSNHSMQDSNLGLLFLPVSHNISKQHKPYGKNWYNSFVFLIYFYLSTAFKFGREITISLTIRIYLPISLPLQFITIIEGERNEVLQQLIPWVLLFNRPSLKKRKTQNLFH